MATYYLSLGSNQNPKTNTLACLDALADQFGALRVSSAYWAQAVGFVGAPFINLAVRLESHWSVAQMSQWLKALEDRFGRDRSLPKFADRTLDVDILQVDQLHGWHEGVFLPRDEILNHSFVLLPMAELAPDLNHPLTQQSYQLLWQQWCGEGQLEVIEMQWRGRDLPILA